MTPAPARVRAGTLLAALLARPARRGDSRLRRLRRLAVAAVLVLVGGTLALCCCVDGPEHPDTTTSATAQVAPGVVADQHPGLAALRSSASEQTGERAGRQLEPAETCGSPAVSGEASPASTGRAMLTAADVLGVVTTSPPVTPLVPGLRTPLLDHLIAEVSPYRLCVMRT